MSARVEEIRTENEHGDVSDTDIEWLCRVADAVEHVLATTNRHVNYATRDLRRTFESRLYWDGPNQCWAVKS